ncbi:MAG: pyruvate ferredoxin oxidoreductase [Candidatus ainarchaeum sp.]|nr:pyruvate ferredoxin oxidoreductase [Candidatus ainarchaeum sp.]
MARKTVEGSFAVAEAVRNCEPDVAACYPITPSTHVAEELANYYADGELKEYITTESELSSMSACIGASAAGSRTVTVTSGQGFALMHEAVYCAAGMRLPIVMIVGNRALSAPLNIWGDWQDAVTERDSGWIQFYCENSQEALDTVPQAYKVAEATLLPAMVCMDGFYITHAVEPVEIPGKEEIRKYLPPFNPKVRLDPDNPVSMGEYALPSHYQQFRQDLHEDLLAAEKIVRDANGGYAAQFGRSYGDGTIEEYKSGDADYVFVSMGSICGNAKEAVDALRAKGEKAGLVRIRLFRPFPYDALAKALSGKKSVGVFEKSYDLGALAPLCSDVSASIALLKGDRPALSSFIGGLGGKDVTVAHVSEMLAKIKQGKTLTEWI